MACEALVNWLGLVTYRSRIWGYHSIKRNKKINPPYKTKLGVFEKMGLTLAPKCSTLGSQVPIYRASSDCKLGPTRGEI